MTADPAKLLPWPRTFGRRVRDCPFCMIGRPRWIGSYTLHHYPSVKHDTYVLLYKCRRCEREWTHRL